MKTIITIETESQIMNRADCESYRENELSLNGGLSNLLRSGQIDPDLFISSSNIERFKLIKDAFNLDKLPNKQDMLVKPDKRFEGLGMVVIKPEALQNIENEVVGFLKTKLQLDIVNTKSFIYSPEEYWIMQGKDLENIVEEFPLGVMLWMLSVTNESKLIMFKHKTVEEYRRLFLTIEPNSTINQVILESNDPQFVFTELFIRNHGEASVREGLCVPELDKRGFLEMKPGEYPALSWDPTGEFGKRNKKQNARAFNGIHSPKDDRELSTHLVILSRLFD